MLKKIKRLEKDRSSLFAQAAKGNCGLKKCLKGSNLLMNRIPPEIEKAENEAKKWFNLRREYFFLILGILLGVVGNVLASGVWDFKSRILNWNPERGFFIVDFDSALIYGLVCIFFFGICYYLFREVHTIDSKFKANDNVVRAHFRAPEAWDAKGKLIPISWNKPQTNEDIKEMPKK